MSEVVDFSSAFGVGPAHSDATSRFERERRDMLAAYDAYTVQNQSPDGTVGRLTSLQTEAFQRTRDFIASGTTHGLLQLPCGYGKSALATTIADAVGAGYKKLDGTKRQVLLNTSRNSIVRQLVDRNVQYSSDIDDLTTEELLGDFSFFAPRLQPSIYNRHNKDTHGDAVVMPYQSLGRVIRSGAFKVGQFSVYLLDESHNIGKKRAQILQDFAGNNAIFLGLSATPERSREFLPTVIDKVSMADGITKYGFLSDIQLYGLTTNCSFYPKRIVAGDYRPEDMEHLASNGARNQLIVDTIYSNVQNHGVGLVKCHPQQSSGFNHLAEVTQLANQNAPLIVRNGVTRKLRVEAVSSRIKGSDAIIEEFIHGDTIDVLTFVDLIGEGFNMPRSQWGIWVPPTQSYRALEQFIGRGIRRDPANAEKVFRFMQLIDTDTRTGNNALGWELFDMPREITAAQITHGQGVEYRPVAGNTTQDEAFVPYHSHDAASRLANLGLDISMREVAPEKTVITLDTIQQTTGIVDRMWLKRILFDGGFPSYMRLVNDEPTLMYEQEAATFAAEVIASPNDLTIAEACSRISIGEPALRDWIERFDIPLTQLYPRVWIAARKQSHLKPAAFQQLKEQIKQLVTPLQPHEVSLREITSQLKMPSGSSRPYQFIMRGFALDSRKTELSRKAHAIGLKDELLPWMQAYSAAKPAPGHGYVSLSSLSRYNFGEDKPTYEDIFIALYNLRIKPEIFIMGQRQRADYIPVEHQEAVLAEIGSVIHGRLAASSDANTQPPKIGGCVYTIGVQSQPTAPRVVKDPIETSQSTPAKIPKYEKIDSSNVEQPLSLQRAVLARHPAFRATDPKSPDHPRKVQSMLRNILGRSCSSLPALPRNWVFVGDLASELQIPELTLVGFMVSKKINDRHARYVEIEGIKGVLAFCSPEFAVVLRNNIAQRQ